MSTDTTTDPAWLTVGAPVASIAWQSWSSDPTRVRHSTVARILKTQVVLDNGERFSRHNLLRRTGSGSWSRAEAKSVPAGSDEAKNAARKVRRLIREQAAETAYEAWRKDRNQQNARAVADTFTALADSL